MNKKTQTEEVQYPRFIPNYPCGIDKFSGGSQKRLAESIAKHLINNDNGGCMPRIIGLEGSWGSGKSNVVKLMQKVEGIKDRYHFFEYDAWGGASRRFAETLLVRITN